ncbi:MAG: polyketide synthase dehydratase domain-containing protein, partial [Acidobacteriaceae bacterium]|nr:polyketide synthase dehydratase domain-containing protein [Acidobacteriaceae bacterium]
MIHSLINANDDVVGKQIITLEAADKAIQTIAEQWLHGVAVVWPHFRQAQRLSLPGHPFEQTRYWLSPASTPANTPAEPVLTIPAVPAITQNAGTQKLRLRLPTPVVNTPSLTDSLASPELLEARSIPEAPASVSLRAEKSETILIQRLRRELASVLYTDEQQIDISRSFIDLGVDSILGIEFVRKLSTELGCTVKTADLYDYPNIEALAKYLKALPVAMENHAAPVNANAVPQTAADPTAMQPELLSRLREILARVLYAETSKIPFQKSFADLGVDSILSVELVRDLNRKFRISLSASVLYDYPQLDALAEYLASLLGPGNRPQNPTRPNVSVHPPATSEPPPPNAAPIHRAEDPFPVQKSDLVRSVEPQAAINAIAIIGCSGRFPQALNLHQFWNNLEEAKCSITTFPPDRRNGNFSTGKTWYGGFLDDIDRFDPLFFNISPADAELIDPQQRLFLIEAYRAIEDAGYAPEQFAGRKGGIFAGVTGSDRYAEMLPAERPAQEMMGNAASILAGRVAFFLDFRGPALTIDTACSSSLVAIHLACRSLLSGETDIALAGGITLYLSEKAWIEMDHAGMLASDGLCKTFDNRADGFVPGEGVGVLVLKRFDQALADGDTVRAVILGTSVNQDGRTNGLTAPSAKSQAALEVQAYRLANIDPSTISYVEAHGTGTKLGDPIEVEALTRAFREWTDARQFCAIGSVKTNIGHTTAAAGVAGVLKVIGAIERKRIPPSLHFETPNEHISFTQSPFFVNSILKTWEQMNNQPRRAAISSFGFSGTNCHLVLEEPSLPERTKKSVDTSQLYVVSGKTPGALSRHISQLADWLGTANGLYSSTDIAFTLARGRSQFVFRAAFVADSLTQLQTQLQAWKPSLQLSAMDTTPGESADQIARELADQTEPSKRRTGLQLLSNLFTLGMHLPMNILFPDHSGKRIPLPTYSFEQEHCWGIRVPPISPPSEEIKRSHLWVKHFSAADPIVKDHQVGGFPILPGTAILLAAHEAISQAPSQTRYDIADLLWVQPVHVPEQGVDLRIELVREDSDWRFQARSGSGVDSHLHAEGRLTPSKAQLENSSWPAVISAISVESSKFYSSMERLQVRYGPAYQQITSLSVDNNYAFAALAHRQKMDPLPDPATFDAALQLIGALASAQRQGDEVRPLLPFALERCTFLSMWPSEAKIRARRAGTDKFDIQVLDQNGQVCVSITGLTLRRSNVLQNKPVVQSVITEAKLPGITPEVWTEADSGRHALNRYARLLARQTIPLLKRYPDQIRPTYQALVKAVFEIAGRPAHATLAELREEHPELKDAFSLLDHCAAALPAVVYGEQLGTTVLFSPDRVSLLESIYASNPIARATNAAVGALVAKASPASVLEFGAGTGATSRAVIKALQDVGHVPSRYLFTDISTAFFNAARSEFPQFEFARFDVSRSPEEQGLLLSGFDVVLGTNVLHVVADVPNALRGLRSLLRPSGVLILNEATSVEDYAVLTFGLTSGWWQAAGESVRLPHSPLLSSAAWIEQLQNAGFETPQEWTAERAFYGSSGQSIFIASAPSAHESEPTDTSGEEDSTRAYVRQVLARVLKLAPERIENTIAFENYGVDSLVVLEINRAFEKDLGRLPATLLFENMTVNALAAYFLRQHNTALRKVIKSISDAPKSQLHIPAISAPQPAQPAIDDRIAIIAVSGRYPLSPDLDSLWENLAAGRSGVRSVPDQRWNWQNATGLKQSSAQERKAGYVDDVDCFDPLHFGISPREAAAMDPQQRLFLQVAATALECAGYTQQRLSAIENRVGVFAGVMSADYEWLAADAAAAGISTDAHSAYWSIANRVSYCLNLQGPSLAVDTACSASLSAVHLACESLRRGECRVAIAGGVNLILHPRHLERLEQAGMLSPSDCCRSFGAEANGFADGEGVGVVLLKPLKAAIEDCDTIWGVILGSAVNAGGRTGGFTVPNPAAQACAIRDALSRAAIDPQSISYIEAHGTGTSLGDPIEIAGLQQVFSVVTPGACALGSVKSNFGHLEAAAGILGLTKILLQMRHQQIVPTLHADLPNPLIEWSSLPFRLNQSLTAWNSQSGNRRASISSFGAGGANAHLIVEEFISPAPVITAKADTQLIVLSARDPDRLAQYKKILATFLERNPDVPLTHLAWNLQAGREVYTERIVVIASTPAEALSALRGDTPHLVMERSGVRTSAHKEQSFMRAALQSRDLKTIADLWLSGVTIDWASLHLETERRWIQTPTYPFARERYWLPVHSSSSQKTANNSQLDWLYEPQWKPHELADVKFSPINGRVLLVISPAVRREISLEQWRQLHSVSQFLIAELDPNNPDSL